MANILDFYFSVLMDGKGSMTSVLIMLRFKHRGLCGEFLGKCGVVSDLLVEAGIV